MSTDASLLLQREEAAPSPRNCPRAPPTSTSQLTQVGYHAPPTHGSADFGSPDHRNGRAPSAVGPEAAATPSPIAVPASHARCAPTHVVPPRPADVSQHAKRPRTTTAESPVSLKMRKVSPGVESGSEERRDGRDGRVGATFVAGGRPPRFQVVVDETTSCNAGTTQGAQPTFASPLLPLVMPASPSNTLSSSSLSSPMSNNATTSMSKSSSHQPQQGIQWVDNSYSTAAEKSHGIAAGSHGAFQAQQGPPQQPQPGQQQLPMMFLSAGCTPQGPIFGRALPAGLVCDRAPESAQHPPVHLGLPMQVPMGVPMVMPMVNPMQMAMEMAVQMQTQSSVPVPMRMVQAQMPMSLPLQMQMQQLQQFQQLQQLYQSRAQLQLQREDYGSGTMPSRLQTGGVHVQPAVMYSEMLPESRTHKKKMREEHAAAVPIDNNAQLAIPGPLMLPALQAKVISTSDSSSVPAAPGRASSTSTSTSTSSSGSGAGGRRKGRGDSPVRPVTDDLYRDDGSVYRCTVSIGQEIVGSKKRKWKIYHEFFGKEVEVFYAEADPYYEPLFKAADVAEAVGKPKNTLSMYLARNKRSCDSGIFQSSVFRFKYNPRLDLKAGCYFLNLNACIRFQRYAAMQDMI